MGSAAAAPDVDGMLDESLIGVLLILLVVLLSTGYVYVQQLQAAGGVRAGQQPAQIGRRGGGPASAAATGVPVNAISTAGLSERQLKLHHALPARNGARTITICADALLDRSQTGVVTWKSEATAVLLADFAHVADVYVLCVLASEKDEASVKSVRDFVTTSVDLKGVVKPHRVLFCTTSIGKIAFVRQLEPQVHIEGTIVADRWIILMMEASHCAVVCFGVCSGRRRGA